MELSQLLLDSLRDLGSIISSSSLGKVRPWKEFCSNFGFPHLDSSRVKNRLITNIIYYQGNYMGLFVLTLVIQMIPDPLFAACIVLILLGWTALMMMKRVGAYINDYRLSSADYLYVGILGTAFFFLLFRRILKIIITLFIFFLTCSIHAVIRKRSIKSRMVQRTVNSSLRFDRLLSIAIGGSNEENENSRASSREPEVNEVMPLLLPPNIVSKRDENKLSVKKRSTLSIPMLAQSQSESKSVNYGICSSPVMGGKHDQYEVSSLAHPDRDVELKPNSSPQFADVMSE